MNTGLLVIVAVVSTVEDTVRIRPERQESAASRVIWFRLIPRGGRRGQAGQFGASPRDVLVTGGAVAGEAIW